MTEAEFTTFTYKCVILHKNGNLCRTNFIKHEEKSVQILTRSSSLS